MYESLLVHSQMDEIRLKRKYKANYISEGLQGRLDERTNRLPVTYESMINRMTPALQQSAGMLDAL